MGQIKYVPGPWHVGEPHPQNACIYVQDVEGHDITVLYGGHDEGAKNGADGNWSEQPIRDATGRLIAAAPEAMDILRKMLQCGSMHDDGTFVVELRGEGDLIGEAEAIIAKVEGR